VRTELLPTISYDGLDENGDHENVELVGTLYNYWSWALDVAISDDYAYVANSYAGLRVVDITNPTAPLEVGYYDTPGNAYDVAVSGNYAYISAYNAGLRVVDISDPMAPNEVGYLDSHWQRYALGIAVSGNYVFVAYEEFGVLIVDITDPTAPNPDIS